MSVEATLAGIRHLLASAAQPQWVEDARLRIVLAHPVSVSLFRTLADGEVFLELQDAALQSRFDQGEQFELRPPVAITLSVPRTVTRLVVAKDLKGLLAVGGTHAREPKAYVLCGVDPLPTVWSEGDELTGLPSPLVRYHHAVRLWRLMAEIADYEDPASGELLFLGPRKFEVGRSLRVEDLATDIAFAEIKAFLTNPDRASVRRAIFVSQLADFLRDQESATAFRCLLLGSARFARRLREGFAIYLAEISPEKLAVEAKRAALDLSEKLEKVIGGLEAKSLSIPVALLLAVKEVAPGMGWTLINSILLVSAFLYSLTMCFIHFSQITLLGVLKTTIATSEQEYLERGLDRENPILTVAVAGLKRRRKLAGGASWLMCVASFIPLACLVGAIFFGTAAVSANSP